MSVKPKLKVGDLVYDRGYPICVGRVKNITKAKVVEVYFFTGIGQPYTTRYDKAHAEAFLVVEQRARKKKEVT